jgi:hypothetical protein
MAMNNKIGPYSGKGSIGKKTSDANIQKAGYLQTAGRDNEIVYDSHKKAVANHDAKILKNSRVPEFRQP